MSSNQNHDVSLTISHLYVLYSYTKHLLRIKRQQEMETRVDRFWDITSVHQRRANNPQLNTTGPGTQPFNERVRSTPNRLVTTEVTLTLNDKTRENILQQSSTDQDNNGVSNM